MKIGQKIEYWELPLIKKEEYHKNVPSLKNKIKADVVALGYHKAHDVNIFFVEVNKMHGNLFGWPYKRIYKSLREVHTNVVLNQYDKFDIQNLYAFIYSEIPKEHPHLKLTFNILNLFPVNDTYCKDWHGISCKYDLNKKYFINEKEYLFLGYNTKTNECLIKSEDGEILTKDHISKMEVIWSPIYNSDTKVKIIDLP